MSALRASVTTFAHSVVEIELAADARDALGVVDRVVLKLQGALGKLVGNAGFDALLARAVILARRASAPLAGVRAAPGARLEGFRESLAGQDTATLTTAAEALVGQFVELLLVLIGEDLGMRLVSAPWPGRSSGSSSKKGKR